METKSWIIENPYEARLRVELPTYKCGKTRRRERRKAKRK